MSFADSDTGSIFSGTPDRPLVFKCSDGYRTNKRITFSSARNCSFALLRRRVEQTFPESARSSYTISYKDDDGEITFIEGDPDLQEAIQYFKTGDEPPISSAASILSGRSFGARKITIRITVEVDYDHHLSDQGSLVSLEEYKDRNGSEASLTFSLTDAIEPEDDSVTVSSRDTGVTGSAARAAPGNQLRAPSSRQDLGVDSHFEAHNMTSGTTAVHSFDHRLPGDPSAVFERLKLAEASQSTSFLHNGDIGAQWLRDQRKQMNGLFGERERDDSTIADGDDISIGTSLSLDETPDENPLSGDLALQRDLSGKYYYTYTSGSSAASQSHDSGYDEPMPRDSSVDYYADWSGTCTEPDQATRSNSLPSSSRPVSQAYTSDPLPDQQQLIHPDIPPEVLQYVGQGHSLPPDEVTECSECHAVLDSFRYVCSTCGERKARPRVDVWHPDAFIPGKGKAREDPFSDTVYPPASQRTASPSLTSSASSWTLGSVNEPRHPLNKPLPSLPVAGPRVSPTLSVPQTAETDLGYELCPACIESVGVFHALSANSAPGVSPVRNNSQPPSPEDSQMALSHLRRAPPKRKDHFRHAYMEKMWGPGGWQDVEQDDAVKCSICNMDLSPRYKCASCDQFNLCRGCYSQVHEIHPSHAFLIVPVGRERPVPKKLVLPIQDDNLGERSMTHSGVKCAHCLLDIVGARFHCGICQSVDICANCESAGLPGNLDAPDGGHNSSHIMIKIPYPLTADEVEIARRRAISLWTGRDAPNVQGRQRANSISSQDARTVVGMRTGHCANSAPTPPTDHRMLCKGCNTSIVGVRYQCANCSSLPRAYNLCGTCEARSYLLHDPMHVFFKLPRPVHHPIESETPILPLLYKIPAGPNSGSVSDDPNEYLQTLRHPRALCDRCMEPILGIWYHCAYCAKDFCSECEPLATHINTHIYLVFKSTIDMRQFHAFFEDPENPRFGPLLQYDVYYS